MRFGGLPICSRVRSLCAALGLWGACALAGVPVVPTAPPQAVRQVPALAGLVRSSDDARSPAPDLKGLGLEGQDSPDASEGMGWALIRTVVVLGLVVGLVYLTLNYGLRRMMGLQIGSAGRQPLVSVVERIPLDPKRSMFVLKAAGEYLLVGGGEGALTLISKLDPAEVARIEGERPVPTSTGISPFLQKLLSRRGGSPPPSA
jgi:flagellar protein FliO/FliZ